MVLDDCIMITQRDEFVLTTKWFLIFLCFLQDPKTVVVIGGAMVEQLERVNMTV